MRLRIFKNVFFTAVGVLIVCGCLYIAVMQSYYSAEREAELAQALDALSEKAVSGGAEALRLCDTGTPRIRYSSETGEVLYETKSEAQNASDLSMSRTLPDKTVIELSEKRLSFLTVAADELYRLVAVFTLGLALALASAWLSAQSVVKNVERLNAERPDERDVFEELRPTVRRISDQNRRIQSQLDALSLEHSRQDAMRREFTANVSHELKTPLTSISGYAEIIRDGVAGSEDVRPFAGKIFDESQRMILLVNDILRLSELDDAQAPRPRERVELMSVCREAAERLAGLAAGKSVSIELEGESAEIWGVRPVIEEIVFNLCDNAIKYNREGGSVRVRTQSGDGGALLEVRDTGIGIPDGDLERVFERFYRVDKSHSREIGGTGLGLSIVKHGAALHGAEIAIESRLEVGTDITVKFPKGEP